MGGRGAQQRGQASGGGLNALLTLAIVVLGLWLLTQTPQGNDLMHDALGVAKDFARNVIDIVTDWRHVAGG